MMLTSNFSRHKYIFKGKTAIWGNSDAYIMVYYGGPEGKEDEFLSANIDYINKRLEWTENSRGFLENVLTENNMLEATEEWIQKANDAKEVEKGVYALKEGQTVSLPLIREAFLSGLWISGLEINYEPDERKPETLVYIHCKPDYFMDGACIQVAVNHDNSIEECWVFRENGPCARRKRSTLPRKMVQCFARPVHL